MAGNSIVLFCYRNDTVLYTDAVQKSARENIQAVFRCLRSYRATQEAKS